MKIESIKLKNFRVFSELNLTNLPSVMVIVGANGTGKSTLFDVFGFLRDSLKNNVHNAVQLRGGFNELITREAKERKIEIELKFRLEISGASRLVTYSLEIKEKDKRSIISKEILAYRRAYGGKPFKFIDFKNGEGAAISDSADFSVPDKDLKREEQKTDPSNLAIKGLGQFEKFEAAREFTKFIENWHASDFQIDTARATNKIILAEHLSPNGDNLSAFTHYIQQNYEDVLKEVIERMVETVPGVADVEAEETGRGDVGLNFKEAAFEKPFISNFVSDGTIKMFAYLLLLNDPEPFPLLCIEEPENQLYPGLMEGLVDEFRIYALKGKGQVFICTHSMELLNAVREENVYWIVKKDGISVIKRLTDHPDLVAEIDAGERPGRLWRQGMLPGVKP